MEKHSIVLRIRSFLAPLTANYLRPEVGNDIVFVALAPPTASIATSLVTTQNRIVKCLQKEAVR